MLLCSPCRFPGTVFVIVVFTVVLWILWILDCDCQ